jgi:two-component system, cell cycle sensor histidine kinase and response regulator CckA
MAKRNGGAGQAHGEPLAAAQQRFEQDFGPIPWPMMVTSLVSGQPHLYRAVSDAFCALTGYTRQELIGREFLCDVHPDDQPALEGVLAQAATSGVPVTARARLVRKDGEAVPVHLSGSTVQPAAGDRYLAACAQDATRAEQATAVIGQLERELARSRRLESLGQLVDGIAHDFRNLLTVIESYASLVHEEVSLAEATEGMTRWGPVRGDIEEIQGAADRAKMLIKHMLAFARRDQARPVPLDVKQLITDTSLLLGPLLGEHIGVDIRVAAGVWPVKADPAGLEQVTTSIAVNARDAMPAGGQLTIAVDPIDTTRTGGDAAGGDAAEFAELLPGYYVVLRFTDTGNGMDPVVAERAFEPFFTTKRGDNGAGLGLATVQRFAAQAGGKAWLRSQPGAGTTVYVALPAVAGSGYQGTSPEPLPGKTEATAGTVLVADDEPAVRDVIHRVLTSAGYRVVTVADGNEALSMLADPGTPADLVLVDVVMPGLTAKAFAAKAAALRPGTAVVFMSGYERPGGEAEGWPDAAAPLLGKPFSRAALLATVTRALTAGRGKAREPGAAAAAAPRRAGR